MIATRPMYSKPLTLTAFDAAVDQAQAAGWIGEEGFIAVSMMLASGMDTRRIAELFASAARVIQ